MRFRDFFDFNKGPQAIVRLALYPFFILIVGSLLIGLVSRMSGTDILLGTLLLILVSPLAYALREQRRGRRQQPKAKRGTERRPLMPQEEEDEE